MPTARLLTIPFSHYSEKARWALDRLEVPYVEDRYLPFAHFFGGLGLLPRWGFGQPDSTSTAFSMPALETDHRLVRDSSGIVRYAVDLAKPKGRWGVGDAEVAELAERFQVRLGPHSRRIAYAHLLAHHSLLVETVRGVFPPRDAAVFERLAPLAARMLRQVYAITPANVARSVERCREECAFAGQLLGRKRFLARGRFTVADLSFATMLAPVLWVSADEGYGVPLPPLDRLPVDFRALVESLRATQGGQHALRLFREERRARR